MTERVQANEQRLIKHAGAVEEHIQDLRRMFNRAYAQEIREGPQAEKMGQTLLANQFVAELCPELKRKLIGVEG